MSSLLLPLKLLLTPVLIAVVSLVGRRWGHGISGWLMGFPLTSGPVSILLYLQYGPDFAAQAAVGTLGGMAAVMVFCLIYSKMSRWTRWPVSAAGAIAAFLLSIAGANALHLSLAPAYIGSAAAAWLVLRLLPRQAVSTFATHTPAWDLPARMLAAAAFVVALTTFANLMGPRVSGLLSPFPIFTVVIAAFTHHQQGPAAAAQLLRGVVIGSFAFNIFFLVVAVLLPGVPAALTYLAATAAALGVNSLALRAVR